MSILLVVTKWWNGLVSYCVEGTTRRLNWGPSSGSCWCRHPVNRHGLLRMVNCLRTLCLTSESVETQPKVVSSCSMSTVSSCFLSPLTMTSSRLWSVAAYQLCCVADYVAFCILSVTIITDFVFHELSVAAQLLCLCLCIHMYVPSHISVSGWLNHNHWLHWLRTQWKSSRPSVMTCWFCVVLPGAKYVVCNNVN